MADDPTSPAFEDFPPASSLPALSAVAIAPDEPALEAALRELTHGLGFDAAVAAIEDWRHFGRPVRRIVTTLPHQWLEPYVRDKLYRVSPLVRHCRRTEVPLVWTARDGLPEEEPFWRFARSHGLEEGISLANHRPQSAAMLTLARRAGAFTAATPQERQRIPQDFRLLALALHDRLLNLQDLSSVTLPARSLSPREVDCLRWAAFGKTSAETAMLLALSEATVNFHIQKAIAKLNASNRQQAVAVATALGLFRLDEA